MGVDEDAVAHWGLESMLSLRGSCDDRATLQTVTEALDRLRSAEKVAFVFSGGSSRCAFQVGVIERLVGARNPCVDDRRCFGGSVECGHRRGARRAPGTVSSGGRTAACRASICAICSPSFRRGATRKCTGATLRASSVTACTHPTRCRASSPSRVSATARAFLLNARDVARPVDLLLAANFLPPFYTRTPRVLGERFGDGGVSNNAPYEIAFEHGCDAVVLVTVKGESEGGLYKSTDDVDHEIPAAFRDRVIVIRPRHRLPYAFLERKWSRITELMTLGDLRAREVLLGERHLETDVRAEGDAPTMRLLRWWMAVRRLLTGGRGSRAEAPAPVEPAQR